MGSATEGNEGLTVSDQYPPEQRDPTLVASGLFVMFLMMGVVGALLSLIGAHWGYLVLFLVMAGWAGAALWWLRRPRKANSTAHPHDGPGFVR